MTPEDILNFARSSLTTTQIGDLAARLIAEMAQPRLDGVAAGTAIRGKAKWTPDEVLRLQVVFRAALERLRSAPVENIKPVIDWLEGEVAVFRGNKA